LTGKTETKGPGSLIYEPFGLVHQWGNMGDAPFTFLAYRTAWLGYDGHYEKRAKRNRIARCSPDWRVTYQNAENGFCVLRVKDRGHREQ
jgi:oxalate decarboxylase/phosphoglucose isomerase-like protein (cupin superfamily)